MWHKICSFPITAYLAVKGFARDLKDDERGLSGVVVAVLLILVAVLAVVAIWGALDGWLEALWKRIIGDGDGIIGRDSY